MPRVIGGGDYESVQRGGAIPRGIVQIPIDMALIPKGALRLLAHRGEMKRRNQIGGIRKAVGESRKWLRWIAARNRGHGSLKRGDPARGIELRQSVERLIGDPILCPIRAHGAEVVVKRAILLNENNNVIQVLQVAAAGRRISQAGTPGEHKGAESGQYC